MRVFIGVMQRRFVAELDLPKVIRVGEVAYCDGSENIFNPDISAKQGAHQIAPVVAATFEP